MEGLSEAGKNTSSPQKRATLSSCLWSSEGSIIGQPGLKPIITQFYPWVYLKTSPHKEVFTVEVYFCSSLHVLGVDPSTRFQWPNASHPPVQSQGHHPLQGALISLCDRSLSSFGCPLSSVTSQAQMITDEPDLLPVPGKSILRAEAFFHFYTKT